MAQKASSPWVSGLLVLVVISLVLGALWVSRPDPPIPIAPDPAPAPVETRQVVAETRVESKTVYGQTQALRRARLDAQQSGLVAWRSDLLEVGAFVEADAVLLRLDPGRLEQQLAIAEAAVQAAQAQLSLAERQRDTALAEAQAARDAEPIAAREAERQAELYANGDGAEALRDQAKQAWIQVQGKRAVAEAAAGAAEAAIDAALAQVKQAEAGRAQAADELQRCEIRAPFAGHVAQVQTEQGAYLMPGAPICELVDLSTLRIQVQVPTEDSIRAQLDQPMTVRLTAFRDADGLVLSRTAHAFAFAPQAGAMNRARQLELRVENADGELPAGAFVDVDLQMGEQHAVWLRPHEFRLDDAGARAVVLNGTTAQLVKLRLGPALIDAAGRAWHPVLEGLNGGETIAVSNLESVRQDAEVLLVAPQSSLANE